LTFGKQRTDPTVRLIAKDVGDRDILPKVEPPIPAFEEGDRPFTSIRKDMALNRVSRKYSISKGQSGKPQFTTLK
jgi:hypothetical protein